MISAPTSGPGNDYHGNAIIRRYAGINIQRDPADHIVSHCVLDKSSGSLYVVDHGNARVVRLNTATGTVPGPGSFGPYESYVEYSEMSGHVWEDVVTTGLVQPAGIELVGNHLLVRIISVRSYRCADPLWATRQHQELRGVRFLRTDGTESGT